MLFRRLFIITLLASIVLIILSIKNIAFIPYLVSALCATIFFFALYKLYAQAQEHEEEIAELRGRVKKLEEYDAKKEIADLSFKVARLKEKIDNE